MDADEAGAVEATAVRGRPRRDGGHSLTMGAGSPGQTPARNGGAEPGAGEDGMVTLEIALGLPIMLLCALVAAWVINLGQTEARLTDAARATAREAARGADDQASIRAGQQVMGGARITLSRNAGAVTARAEDTVTPPGILSGLRRHLAAEVTAASEQP